MKVAITGSSGIVGSTFVDVLTRREIPYLALTRDSWSLSENSIRQVANSLRENNITIFIHCAANTNVEQCEVEEQACYKDNYLATEFLASICSELGIKFVYISSTGVYGDHAVRPYSEYDEVHPTTHHHRAKYLAELSVKGLVHDHLIVRTGWIFGGKWHMNKNFVANRIREAITCNGFMNSDNGQFGCPTSAEELCEQVFYLIQHGFKGLFNCVNKGTASRFEYVSKIIELSKKDVIVHPVNSEQFTRKAKVSKNETANNFKLDSYGINKMSNWELALERYMEKHKLEFN